MARSIYTAPHILDVIGVIQGSEEHKYSDIPGFEGEFLASSPNAVLLVLAGRGVPRREVWFPFSQLRVAEDRLSLYATNWVLDQKL